MSDRFDGGLDAPVGESSPVNLSDEQRDLAVGHLPLIGAIAKDIGSKVPIPVNLEELESVGAGGLIDAALHYGAESPLPFGIYARRSIRGAIITYLSQSTAIGPAQRLLA